MPLPPLAIPALQFVETLRVSAPTIFESLFGLVTRDVCDRRLDEWAAHAVRVAAIDLHLHGLDRVPRGEPFVVMSNHQSNYDIFVLMHAYPGTLRMVSKKEVFQIPVVGKAMRLAQFVELDRHNPQRARAALEEARLTLRSGVNLWIAPEGTRSRDGHLGPFKKGGFWLAMGTGVRILPITLRGTRDVMPVASPNVYAGKRVDVIFHEPVDPATFGPNRRNELVDAVREVIGSGLGPDYPPASTLSRSAAE